MRIEFWALLARIGKRWNHVWFQPLAPYPLAAMRIAFAAYLLGYFLQFVSIVELSFSNEGVYSPYLLPDIAPAPICASVIYCFTLLSIVALACGFFTRIAAVLVCLLFVYHFLLNSAVNNCVYDRLNVVVLIVLCVVDSGAAWSFDARGKSETRLVPAWHIRLLQFQLAALYFGSGLWKLFSPAWYTGDMLRFTLAGGFGLPLAFELLSLDLPGWCFTLATWGVIAFELFAGFGLYWRKTRTWTMIAGAAFHLCNTFLLFIPGFLNCVALYALFIPFGAKARHDSTPGQPAATDNAAAVTGPAASG